MSETNDYVCPRCDSKNINNKSFDFFNYCNDCGYDWRIK